MMEGCTMAPILKIKKKDLAFITGLTEEGMKGSGRMEKEMERENLFSLTGTKLKDFGSMIEDKMKNLQIKKEMTKMDNMSGKVLYKKLQRI